MKYKVGDKVLVKSIDWYNENKDASGDVLCFHGVHKFTKEMSKFCNKTVTISTNITGDGEYLIKEDDETNWWTDDMIECKVIQLDVKTKSEKENIDCEKCGLTHNSTRCLFMDNCPHNKQKTIIEIPEDWVLKDENGDEILTSKIILEKKKREYPKTYEECCKVFGLNHYLGLSWNSYDEYSGVITCLPKRIDDIAKKLESLSKLIICRNAYWKLYGEEMGLGKPWEPDWSTENEIKYVIEIYRNNVRKNSQGYSNTTLAFPTEEICYEFKKNFDPDIEFCKEFL